MQPLSIIIICKNEEEVIGTTLQALQGLTDDIIVYDNGSTDRTLEIARQYPVAVHEGTWEGYGRTKQKTTSLAKYDWILSLDADEIMDNGLKQAILALNLKDPYAIYAVKRKNHLNGTYLAHGEWGSDWQNRLFNRQHVNWDDGEVHETLVKHERSAIHKLNGALEHQTMRSIADYAQKTVNYASLSAEKYFRKGKRSGWVKIRVAPAFTFFKYYIVKLGFLDGYYGYICAKMASHYTFLKYSMLKELEQQKQRR